MSTQPSAGSTPAPGAGATVTDGKLSARLIGISVTAALGGFLFGFDSAVINGAVEAVRDQFALSAGLTGFAVSCALLGAALGAWYAGICSEKFGRVRTMIIAAVLLGACAIGSAFAFGVYDLIFWRFIGGIGVGFASVIAPAYIAEVSPSAHRGRLATLQQMAIVIGIFMALFINAVLVRVAGSASLEIWGMSAWRWMFLAQIVPATAYGLLSLRLPESPRYLVVKGDMAAAERTLREVVGVEPDSIDRTLADIQATVRTERRQKFSDLLGGRFGFQPLVWVGIILAVFQQLVGINVIFYYSTLLWRSVGFQESDSFTITVITSIINIVATVIAISLIDVVGRKVLLIAGSVIMAVSLATMALAFSQAVLVNGEPSLPGSWGPIALVAANLFVIGFGTSWGPVMWVLLGEMFPNNIRALALGIGAACNWIANFVVSTTFPVLADGLGLSFTYGLYAASAALSLVFVLKAVKETNGRRLEDMRMDNTPLAHSS